MNKEAYNFEISILGDTLEKTKNNLLNIINEHKQHGCNYCNISYGMGKSFGVLKEAIKTLNKENPKLNITFTADMNMVLFVKFNLEFKERTIYKLNLAHGNDYYVTINEKNNVYKCFSFREEGNFDVNTKVSNINTSTLEVVKYEELKKELDTYVKKTIFEIL